MSTLRIGLVGCGRAGAGLHLPALRHAEGVDAVAVADADLARARRVAADFGIARAHADVEELLDAVDLVAVATPPESHAEVATAVLAAGKPVFVEKPLARDVADADAIVAAAEGRVGMTGFNLRCHRQVREAREALAAGRLGRLLMIRTHWTAAWRPPGGTGPERSGLDALWDMGVHHFDLWRHLAGDEAEVTAATLSGQGCIVQGRSGEVLLATTLAVGASDANEVELVGERGRMTLTLYRGNGPRLEEGTGERLRTALGSVRDLPRQASVARAGGDYLASFTAEWEAVRRAVVEGAPPHATLDDGRAAVALAAAAEQELVPA